MNRILVVEDDDSLRGDLVDYLCLQGFDARGIGTAGEVSDALKQGQLPDVILLDVALPDGDGYCLARDIRARLNCGIIMLTAHGDTESRVRGFESGADIYLVKHTALREIAAAVHSLLRRLPQEAALKDAAKEWVLDAVSWILQSPEGQEIKLTATEKTFVEALIGNAGKPCSREDLARTLSRRQTNFENRHLDAVASRLRRKISSHTNTEAPIKSVYGIGYSFSASGTIGNTKPD
ncbi:response regulator transcription factor [Nitratireductor kimnyeongensis]|uniref:Response regulator transcription factor n=1 Tax=Nitratireductor kimnyeongensis TaxID=430679 RepID=A0ABW0T361_9HYPH|nr:response regulator transcription factor [Nitratireductor kimnyeongensis]QZZ35151.1 response regulator transcription factor [Nitratireductor kimnyeongensis]